VRQLGHNEKKTKTKIAQASNDLANPTFHPVAFCWGCLAACDRCVKLIQKPGLAIVHDTFNG